MSFKKQQTNKQYNKNSNDYEFDFGKYLSSNVCRRRSTICR